MQQRTNAFPLPLAVSIDGIALTLSVFMIPNAFGCQKINHLIHQIVCFSSPAAKPKHNIVHEVFHKLGLNCICKMRPQWQQAGRNLSDPSEFIATGSWLSNRKNESGFPRFLKLDRPRLKRLEQ